MKKNIATVLLLASLSGITPQAKPIENDSWLAYGGLAVAGTAFIGSYFLNKKKFELEATLNDTEALEQLDEAALAQLKTNHKIFNAAFYGTLTVGGAALLASLVGFYKKWDKNSKENPLARGGKVKMFGDTHIKHNKDGSIDLIDIKTGNKSTLVEAEEAKEIRKTVEGIQDSVRTSRKFFEIGKQLANKVWSGKTLNDSEKNLAVLFVSAIKSDQFKDMSDEFGKVATKHTETLIRTPGSILLHLKKKPGFDDGEDSKGGSFEFEGAGTTGEK
jgi:hypothetical protein